MSCGLSVINSYEFGNMVTLNVIFTDVTTNMLVDPSIVTLRVLDPNNVEKIYTGSQVIRNSLGNYSYPVFGDLAGIWNYRWEGSGNVVAAQESQFNIIPSVFSDAI